MTTTPNLPLLPFPVRAGQGDYSSGDMQAYALAAYQAGRDAAYESGWRNAALWAGRGDLIADIGSPAYERDKDEALKGAVPSSP